MNAAEQWAQALAAWAIPPAILTAARERGVQLDLRLVGQHLQPRQAVGVGVVMGSRLVRQRNW